MKLADEKGMSENGQVQERMPIMLCNLAQNPGYWNQLDTKMAPALLRNSVLFDIKRGRLVEVYPEHFLVMGYPTPCSETQVPDRLAQFFSLYWLGFGPHALAHRARPASAHRERHALVSCGCRCLFHPGCHHTQPLFRTLRLVPRGCRDVITKLCIALVAHRSSMLLCWLSCTELHVHDSNSLGYVVVLVSMGCLNPDSALAAIFGEHRYQLLLMTSGRIVIT